MPSAFTPRRHNQLIERGLHEECALRLKLLKPRCIWISPPNGMFLPARTETEKTLVRRLISQMKTAGMLTVGAPDFVFMWPDGSGAIELKKPETSTLFTKTPAGRLSADQKTFRDWCTEMGVPYEIAHSWDEMLAILKGWGRV